MMMTNTIIAMAMALAANFANFLCRLPTGRAGLSVPWLGCLAEVRRLLMLLACAVVVAVVVVSFVAVIVARPLSSGRVASDGGVRTTNDELFRRMAAAM